MTMDGCSDSSQRPNALLDVRASRGHFQSHRMLGALALGLMLVGCGRVEQEPEMESSLRTGGTSFAEFAARVPREPETGFYIVDGDIPLYSLEELRAFYEQYVRKGALTVYTTEGVNHRLWPESQRQNLSYCVSTAFGNQYFTVVQAMASAAAAWQGPTGVRFVYRSEQDGNCNASNPNVLFDVRPVSSGGQYLARAFFPNADRPARNVLIDWSAFSSSWSVTGILRHELGHVMGFRHEHIRPEAGGRCSEDGAWTGVTSYDSASVMHYPQCNGTNYGDLVLTQRDIDGASIAYGQRNFVGVIPAANGCPASAPEVRFNMDNEDSDEASSVSGWRGGTERDGNGNLRFVFCRVDANQFRPLNAVSSSRSNYAVLRLSGRCPSDSVEFERHFDNEDSSNANNSSGILWPSTMDRNTRMRFCLFRGAGSYSSGLPDLGFDYGVFAESSFGFTTSGGTGTIYSDDEDSNTANGYYPTGAAWYSEATRIISDGTNTTLRTARRGSPYCGDYRCNALETRTSCPRDCEVCGDGFCGGSESAYSCRDCASCGDGICTPGEYCRLDCGNTCPVMSSSAEGLIPACPDEPL